MAQLDSEETLNIPATDVMTGDKTKYLQLYYQLISSMRKAERIDIIVSFLMESGVKMLLKDLDNAIKRGASIRILTGNYLGITQPSALYLIKHKLGDRVDIRFYSEKERSFHPKAYIFHYDKFDEVFIGSSNISRSALTSGIEWNYKINSLKDSANCKKFSDTFEDLFNNHSIIIDDEELKRYSKNWHRPLVSKDIERLEENENPDEKVRMIFEPRGAQIEALAALDNSRAEGADKGLVYAATGIGKTYLAAFDSQEYNRVLFVAHREEILKQAATSFRNVRMNDDFGFFDGKNKDTNKSVIFASVSTLGRKEYLNSKYFDPEYFDYIVVDEFHHAVTSQYKKIVEYFKPKFLLGLTATPERMDGKNIYELCDYNVPFELPLKEAINKGILVPFRYYGIYDDTDYSNLHLVRGRYDDKELNETYIGNVKRYDLIYKYYKKYGSKRAMGFCCSRQHAEDMAKEFNNRGVPSVAVYSNSDGEYSEDRKTAVEGLVSGKYNVLFSVDMFNEGVDIPSVDMVMFLRPTESPVVFTQQLGRGLRKIKGKEYLKVLDFIGNYHNAGNIRNLLYDNGTDSTGSGSLLTEGLPDECVVDFDMRLIDLFEELDKKSIKIGERVRNEYYRIKEQLEHVPSRVELFTYMDSAVYDLMIRNSKENILRNYIDFLDSVGDLSSEQKKIKDTIGKEFLTMLEQTSMSKVYKMPVLMAFYENGYIHMDLSEQELLASWKSFFDKNLNWRDLDENIIYEQYKAISDKDHIKKIKQMPVHFLMESGKGFFVNKEGSVISLAEELRDVVNLPGFIEEMKDIVDYRALNYYQRRYIDAKQ